MPSRADTLEYFLFDVGLYIKERALKAKAERDASERGSPAYEFDSGRVLAFNEVISILQQTLAGFEISAATMQLHDIDPDRDLT